MQTCTALEVGRHGYRLAACARVVGCGVVYQSNFWLVETTLCSFVLETSSGEAFLQLLI